MATPPRTLGSGGSNAPGGTPTDDFDRDLHGDDRAGQHAGAQEVRTYSAYDVKELHERMPDFTNDELKRIVILAHGERLEQGGIYVDLSEENGEPFTAQGNQEAQDPHLYVPKARMDYELWNRLTKNTA
jgi:hypothetical protein